MAERKDDGCLFYAVCALAGISAVAGIADIARDRDHDKRIEALEARDG